MAQKSPAFQFYPKDFLSDGNVSQMSLQELGAYITLLCLCWIEGSLPTDTQRLANMVGVPARVFLKLWPAVRACFVEQDGRLLHPRLEREREKQEQYRRRQSDAGRASAATRRQPEGNHGSTTVQPPLNQTPNQTATTGQPEPNSPISYLQSPNSVLRKERTEPEARSKWPVFKGQRLVVFDWQLDDHTRLLGPDAEPFDLHGWYDDLDRRCVERGWVPPKRDNGEWLQAQLLAEAQTRGLNLRVVSADASSDRTDVTQVESLLRRQGVL